MNVEQPSRKPNRIKEYDYGQQGCYFITICTQNRLRLFDPEVGNDPCVVPYANDKPQNRLIRNWLVKLQETYSNMYIEKYAIMPDHLHILLTIQERHAGRSLPDMVRFFKTMTTNAYIRGVRDGSLQPFAGKLWQKSYYDHIIRNQQDYNEVCEYIDNNPLAWKEKTQGET